MLERSFPNFKQYVIDGYKPDIFIHTWDEEGWWVPSDKNTVSGVYDNTPKVDIDDLVRHYLPKEIVMESWSDYNSQFEERGNSFQNFAHRPKNILSMFYKLSRGVSLMENYSSRTGTVYDFVFRMRPDMIFEENFPNFHANKFYTLAHRNHMQMGTGDMLQAGNMFSVIMFSKIACFLDPIYKKTNILCPHVMSEQWIRELGLPWEEFIIRKKLQHTPKGEYIEVDK